MSAARILVVDDEAGLREMLKELFRRAGFEVEVAGGVKSALRTIDESPPFDVVVTDLLMPDGTGMEVLTAVREKDERSQSIMITAYATTEQAVQAMRMGAYDYVQKPFRNDTLRVTVEKALEKRNVLEQNRILRAQVKAGFQSGNLIGKSAGMRKVGQLVARIANAPTSVLITGESGTGKEVVAKEIHLSGTRKDKAFVAVNCGALPEHLMESELFGHEKGAFTGASRDSGGLFRAAEGGTLFLDEVGELPAALQVKLLRVLQEKTVRPVGGQKEIPVDARVVAATNRNIDEDVKDGSFRQDLFYRLNVIRLDLPPLRHRPEDILPLAEHFLRKHGAVQDKHLSLDQDATRKLSAHTYPGNVRELENLIERAVTLAAGPVVTAEDLGAPQASAALTPEIGANLGEDGMDLDAHLGLVERKFLDEALARTEGNRTQAAKLLKMSFRSLRYRLAKYGYDED